MKRQQKDGPFFGKEDRFWQKLEIDSPLEKELAVKFKRLAKVGDWMPH